MSKKNNHPAVVEQSQNQMIMPAGTVDQALEAFNQYQSLKQALGSSEDFQRIGDKHHPKKSFVRKVQRFFNVSCEIIQDEPLRDRDGKIIAWLAKARATHQGTGAFQEADGSCGIEEKKDKNGKIDPQRATIHNIRSHAITRAKNRAILDLVGFGEVSAEEVNERNGGYRQSQWQPTRQQPNRQEQPQSEPVVDGPKMASQKQRSKIFAMGVREKKLTREQVKKLVKYNTGKDSTSDLTSEEASDVIKLMGEMSGPELVQLIGESFLAKETENIPEAEIVG